MLDWLSEKAEKWARPADDTATSFYAAVAEASRNPDFYDAHGVDDSIDGRFDVLVLHAVLVVRRLAAIADGAGEAASQGLLDTMFADLDLSLHEMGVGENKVGRKVKTMATAWLGRMKAYGDGLDRGERSGLAKALGRNLYRGKGSDASANRLAAAMLEADRSLKALADGAVTPDAVAAVLGSLGPSSGAGKG